MAIKKFQLDDANKNEQTEPKSEKEKALAALGHPKNRITHKDVLIGRGVIKKEGWDSKKPAVSEEKDSDAPFAGPYRKTPQKQKDQKSNPSMSRARDLARKAMQNLVQKKKDKKFAEQFVLEGKMGQLHADIGDHLDKHIKDYNAGNLGHDSFGEKVVAAGFADINLQFPFDGVQDLQLMILR